jgi:hypothetical protein
MKSFFIEDAGDGWWHCPSPLQCEVLDGPAPHEEMPRMGRLWLVRTDPWIEWHGDEQYIALWGADHPLGRPMAPTPFALVKATSREPVRPDLGILNGSVPVGPVRSAPPTDPTQISAHPHHQVPYPQRIELPEEAAFSGAEQRVGGDHGRDR